MSSRRRGAALALLLAAARAHPHARSSRACGAWAHPDRADSPHGAPAVDAGLNVSLFWADGYSDRPLQAASRPTLEEWREANAHLALPRGAFVPGARHAVLFECGGGRACQLLLTSDCGAFQENGLANNGARWTPGVQCEGKRYNVESTQQYHVFSWTACDGASAQLDVTAVTGERASFMRLPRTVLSAARDLPKPPPSARPGGGALEAGLSAAYCAHAALASLAFFALLPASVSLARLARAAPARAAAAALAPASEQPAGAKGASSLRERLARDRVSLHQAGNLAAAVLLCAAYACALGGTAAEGSPHLASAHSRWGVAALVLVAYQLQGGLLRPPAAEPPSAVRSRWRRAHALCGSAALVAGWVAAALGLARALDQGVRAEALAVVAGCAALAAVALPLFVGAEVAARCARRRAGAGATRGVRSATWMELGGGELRG